MQLTNVDSKQGIRIFWGLLGLLAAVMFFTAKTQDPILIGAAVLLALVAVLPLYLWLLGWSQGLPAWQIFAFVTGLTYALPIVQVSRAMAGYSTDEIVAGAMVTVGFILAGTMMSLAFENRSVRPPKKLLMITQKESVRYLLLFVALGLLFGLNDLLNIVRFPGNTRPVFRGIVGSLSTMGLFVLAYYQGKRLLDNRSKLWFGLGIFGTAIMGLSSLMLAEAVVPLTMAVFGYTLGSSKVPWRVLALLFVVLSLLHAGKWEMRAAYWGGGESGQVKQLTVLGLPQFYSEWTQAGLRELGGFGGILKGSRHEDSEAASTFFERSGSLHMLLLVMRKSPSEVPYLNGATYAPIPALLVPRFLNDQKGISHVGNQLLSVNYGMVDLESVATVSIGWGLIPEAYANFGLVGVLGLALVMSIFYSWVGRLTVGVPMTSLRFVTGLLIVSAATKADTMAIFITSQFQGIVGVSIAAYLLMKRLPNPFYEQGAGVRSVAGSDGLPAPSLLSDLIEGTAKARRAAQKANGSPNGTVDQRASGRSETAQAEGKNGRQLAADGGVVRALPSNTPKRVASWMPRRMRAAVVAQYAASSEEGEEMERPRDQESKRPKDGRDKPRQLAVPFQNYRRYRG